MFISIQISILYDQHFLNLRIEKFAETSNTFRKEDPNKKNIKANLRKWKDKNFQLSKIFKREDQDLEAIIHSNQQEILISEGTNIIIFDSKSFKIKSVLRFEEATKEVGVLRIPGGYLLHRHFNSQLNLFKVQSNLIVERLDYVFNAQIKQVLNHPLPEYLLILEESNDLSLFDFEAVNFL